MVVSTLGKGKRKATTINKVCSVVGLVTVGL